MPPPSRSQGADHPTFSVLIAAYNQGEYVVDTLDSVAAQTSPDYEIVVVDDGSTDDTREKVDRWKSRFRESHPQRVVLETIQNSGQSGAMEHGFGFCSGEYVCLLDSDDRWLPHKLERVLVEARANPEAGMLLHPLYVVDSAGTRTGDVRPRRAAISEGDLRSEVRRHSRIAAPATSGVVIRRDVFHKLLPMPTRRFPTAADLYLTLGAALIAPVAALTEPLAEYRMHSDGRHIRTMLSTEGLRYWVELQTTIIHHLGLQDAVKRNAYFLRHEFALAKLEAGISRQLPAVWRLLLATWRDPSFSIAERILLIGFWKMSFLAPRPVFRRLWRWFQVKHTGFDRIEAGELPNGAGPAG